MSTPTALTVATEVWNTRKGQVVKAVVRTDKGQIVGATNQTAPVTLTLTGRK